jgi:hypothetical protein
MHVYTPTSELAAFLAHGACFVGDAALRAGSGCLGLAIQDYCAVQAYLASANGVRSAC